MIAEKEKLYVELKGILSRQPGPEVVPCYQPYGRMEMVAVAARCN